MIITRVPFRISFFGGGTDYPSWYQVHGGAVLSTTIDKYCYLTARWLPPFFDHRIRLAYSQVEHCNEIDEIRHPAFREILRLTGIVGHVEAHYDADLPARSGMGSSSAFAVGLLHALRALQGQLVSPAQLARDAIYVERQILKEAVGSQDQVAVAHGGLNLIRFCRDDSFSVEPLSVPTEVVQEVNRCLLLFFTGTMRTASEVAKSYGLNLLDQEAVMHRLAGLVPEAIGCLERQRLTDFGRLLHEGWRLKKSLSPKISTETIEEVYTAARAAGALGGKLLGAGGGGFLLLFVPPDHQEAVRERLRGLLCVPFRFDSTGSQIIYSDPGCNYSGANTPALVRADAARPEFTTHAT
jgi:D-glycero-alpha-D-manno-heptose-7-phosphate kinase